MLLLVGGWLVGWSASTISSKQRIDKRWDQLWNTVVIEAAAGRQQSVVSTSITSDDGDYSVELDEWWSASGVVNQRTGMDGRRSPVSVTSWPITTNSVKEK